MHKTYLLFDLDGTLTDPMEGITKSVQYALKAKGIEEQDRSQLCPFIGPPLRDSFIKYYGYTEEEATEGIKKYREYFEVNGWSENVPYDRIDNALKKLREAGYTLLVATSKPEVFAIRILKHFGLDSYFSLIGGADLDEIRVRKGDVIRYVLERCHITDTSKAIMIGDREHDVIGAKENHMECIGVLYGYGSRDELEKAGADYIAESVDDLVNLLLPLQSDNIET